MFNNSYNACSHQIIRTAFCFNCQLLDVYCYPANDQVHNKYWQEGTEPVTERLKIVRKPVGHFLNLNISHNSDHTIQPVNICVLCNWSDLKIVVNTQMMEPRESSSSSSENFSSSSLLNCISTSSKQGDNQEKTNQSKLHVTEMLSNHKRKHRILNYCVKTAKNILNPGIDEVDMNNTESTYSSNSPSSHNSDNSTNNTISANSTTNTSTTVNSPSSHSSDKTTNFTISTNSTNNISNTGNTRKIMKTTDNDMNVKKMIDTCVNTIEQEVLNNTQIVKFGHLIAAVENGMENFTTTDLTLFCFSHLQNMVVMPKTTCYFDKEDLENAVKNEIFRYCVKKLDPILASKNIQKIIQDQKL